MADLTLRNVKGSPLTNQEVDDNFSNLNTDKWSQDNTKISNWDTAYSWGDHAAVGYLTALTLDGLTDVSVSGATNGQSLVYNSTSGEWEASTPASTLGSLTDVSIAGVTDGQALVYNSTSGDWEASTPASALDFLTDVSLTSVTTGDLLQYDGTDWVNSNAIDGTVIGGSTAAAGSFTTLTASGDVNFDSGTLFVDASENKVGIGTSSPAHTLQVNGSIVSSDGTTTARIATSGGVGLVSTLTNHPLAFQTNDTERMRIDSSGNLGIGATDFSQPAKVIINGGNAGLTAGDSVEIFRVGDGRANIASDGLRLSAVRDTTAGSTANWETQTLRLERNIDNVAPQSGIDFSPSILKLRTGGTERMRIDGSGNLLFNSGYGSVATAYGCRAWVNFDGTGTVAIRGSGNVSSITDNGTGDYFVNFANAMTDANGACVTDGSNGPDAYNRVATGAFSGSGKTEIAAFDTYTNTKADLSHILHAVFR
jgi:hypothetical protein